MKTPNWYVITGVPSSGKTTILSKLRTKGYLTVEEAARTYIDQELKSGKTVSEIRKNEVLFQRRLLEIKLQTERKLPREKIVFFDRGIPDSLAYYVLCGVHYDRFLARSIIGSAYKKVFLFEPLDYVKDYARTEKESDLEKLHILLKKSYEQLRIPVITVSAMNIEERLSFVMNHID